MDNVSILGIEYSNIAFLCESMYNQLILILIASVRNELIEFGFILRSNLKFFRGKLSSAQQRFNFCINNWNRLFYEMVK